MSGTVASPAALQRLRALPKAEQHVHFEGSLRPALLMRLAERNGVKLPFTHPDQFRRLYTYRDFRDFANALLLGVACLRQPRDFTEAVEDMGSALVGENVRYAEVTWTPQFYLNRGFPLDTVLAAMNEARQALEARHGLVIRWIPDLVRSYPRPSAVVARWACSPAARRGGVVALGLGGPEAGHPADGFEAVFAEARSAHLPANPHAGEGDGPASVWATLRSLQPVRIGHGVRSIEDRRLVGHLAASRIPLEVCLTSNVVLGVVPSYERHPVKELIDAGCLVTLNTDDPVLFGTTLSAEYAKAMTHCGLGLADIRRAILTALSTSYLEAGDKARMVAEFEAEFARQGCPA